MTETAARIIETTCRNWKMFLTANELERLTGRKRSDAQDPR